MRVFATKRFHKERNKQLSESQQAQLEEFVSRLKRGSQRAKPLRGRWLYEVKLQGKRAYFVATEQAELFVAASGKKDQDEKISRIVKHKEVYLGLLNKWFSTR